MVADWVAGPETLTPEELGANRCDFGEEIFAHPLDNCDYWQSRMPDWSKVTVPFLSAANWGGQGLHPRGNFEAFVRAASKEKWLEVHGIEHWTEFYTDYGVALQKRFFGHFLKGEETGWRKQPRVQLQVRHIDRFVQRMEGEWPVARTAWTKFYLNPADYSLGTEPVSQAGSVTYDGLGDGVTFLTPPLEKETEITGPIAAKLFLSSETEDADLFLVLRVFAPDLKEIVFPGALDPHTPIAQGWLRASHRKLDPEAHAAVPPLSYARRKAAAEARRGVRARCGGLADLGRRPRRLPDRAHRAREGLRLSRRRREAGEHEERVHGGGALSP